MSNLPAWAQLGVFLGVIGAFIGAFWFSRDARKDITDKHCNLKDWF